MSIDNIMEKRVYQILLMLPTGELPENNNIISKVQNRIVKRIIIAQTYDLYQIDHRNGVHLVVLAACR